MEITKININTNECRIFALIVIITLIFFLILFFEKILCFSISILLSLPIIFAIIHKIIPTNEYTICYNKDTSTQTMTTQEIVDIIMSKNVYDEPNGQTSTISITLPKENNDNYDDVYHHIEEIEENTYNQKIEQEEQKQREQYNELSQKYLNETHKVNVKK